MRLLARAHQDLQQRINSISKGHTVTLYERNDKIGGLLRYGIPDFKLEKWVIDRRIKIMEDEGVTFLTNSNVGQDIDLLN